MSSLSDISFIALSNFEVIAKKKSEGFTADKGGHHDWTTQGALKSTALDAALFKEEMNKLSEIIEDEEGFHIIVVLDREAARKQPMEEVQLQLEGTGWSYDASSDLHDVIAFDEAAQVAGAGSSAAEVFIRIAESSG